MKICAFQTVSYVPRSVHQSDAQNFLKGTNKYTPTYECNFIT
jgi:hypothetical protein